MTALNPQLSTLHPEHEPDVPEYLPARMLNEFVYCPRLFYYEWVEGLFVDNRETVEGSLRHRKLDAKTDELPAAEDIDEASRIHSRSITLSSDEYGLIAKMDLVDAADGQVTPVDYKRGSPRKDADGLPELWPTDRVQLAVQGLVLRANGYRCEEGVVYYVTTKQRVRVAIDDALVAETLDALRRARETAAAGKIPPPLVNSPKCPRCSLVSICLPDETTVCHEREPAGRAGAGAYRQLELFETGEPRAARIEANAFADAAEPAGEVRRLVPARDDLRPMYLNTQGFRVGVSGNVLQVRQKDKLVQEVRIGEICQLNLMGNIQLTTQAVQALCREEVPIAYFSMGGWFYGVTQALGVKNIFLRREQFRMADVPAFCLRLARALVAGKIRNQRTMLLRNHVEPPRRAIDLMKCMCDDAERAQSFDELLGIEGNGARLYFENFAGMIKIGADPAAEFDGGDPAAMNDERSETSDGPAEPRGGGRSANGNAGAGRGQQADALVDGGSSDAHPSSFIPHPSSRSQPGPFAFDFAGRNRRPPRDPVNALLSLAYSVLAKDLAVICQVVGFDPYQGFYHQPRFGRASLALDLMEPFRPLIADSAVLSAINTRMVSPGDFLRAGQSVALSPSGRKAFFRAYEQRMDTLVTHPLFGYRINYRRMLDIQTRLLARVLTGELNTYSVFTTR